jgi:hypothetical protein
MWNLTITVIKSFTEMIIWFKLNIGCCYLIKMPNAKCQMTNDKWQMTNDKCQMPVSFCSFQNVGEIGSWKFSLVLYQPTYHLKLHKMPSGGSIVVEQLPHHPKVQGLSPATAAESGKESSMKN